MNQEPVIRRKLVRTKPQPEPASPGAAFARALPRAIMRALGSGTGLSTQAGAVSTAAASLQEVPDRLPDEGFVATLARGDDAGGAQTGLIALDGQLFSALVESMTIGRLADRPSASRRPTSTDGAILRAVIERLMSELGTDPGSGVAAGPPASPADDCRADWELSRCITDPRLLVVLMEDRLYTLYRCPVTLSSGKEQRVGELMLVLPASTADASGSDGRAPGGAMAREGSSPSTPGDPAGTGFEAQVMAAPVQLNSVLGRVVMPLAQVMEFSSGTRVELPISKLEEVELTGLDGRVQALARLGQTRGMRALRVVAMTESMGLVAARSAVDLPDPAESFVAATPPSVKPAS